MDHFGDYSMMVFNIIINIPRTVKEAEKGEGKMYQQLKSKPRSVGPQKECKSG